MQVAVGQAPEDRHVIQIGTNQALLANEYEHIFPNIQGIYLFKILPLAQTHAFEFGHLATSGSRFKIRLISHDLKVDKFFHVLESKLARNVRLAQCEKREYALLGMNNLRANRLEVGHHTQLQV